VYQIASNEVFLSKKQLRTMTQKQALAALEALTLLPKNSLSKIYKNSLAYQTAVEAVNKPGTFISCGAHTGTGRFASSKSWQYDTSVILNRADISHECINDAVRGGRAGDKIRVIHLWPEIE
jgi:hypothetical protein